MSKRADRIRNTLLSAFAPAEVEVIDDSHHHAGHAGARPGDETHYTVRVVSPAFAGLTRVAQHKLVYDALGGRMGGVLHALALTTGVPQD